MNFLDNAFKSLQRLNEETFDLSAADTPEELGDFLDQDSEIDSITIIDDEAKNEDEIQDSYMGKVILDCNVCHSLLYKNPEEVIEDGEDVNVDEECPFCYSQSGYKVVGQVKPFVREDEEEDEEESEEEEETEEDGSEEETDEEEKEEKVEESFKPVRARRINEACKNTRKKLGGKKPVDEFLDFGCVNAQGQTIGVGVGGGTGISQGGPTGAIPGMGEDLDEEKELDELFGKKKKNQQQADTKEPITEFDLFDILRDKFSFEGADRLTDQNLWRALRVGASGDGGDSAIKKAMQDGDKNTLISFANKGFNSIRDSERWSASIKSDAERERKKEAEWKKSRDTEINWGGHKPKAPSSGKWMKNGAWQWESLKEAKGSNFLSDADKMYDFQSLSKDEFLKSYSYLSDEEYDATQKAFKALDKDLLAEFKKAVAKAEKDKVEVGSDCKELKDVCKKMSSKKEELTPEEQKRKDRIESRGVIRSKDREEYNELRKKEKGIEECDQTEELKEGFNKVDIETDDQHLMMDSDESGKVTITTEPKQADEFGTDELGDETLGAVDLDVQQEIETNSEEGSEEEAGSEEEISTDEIETEEGSEEGSEEEVDEFDEESFDELGESYLKKVYGNVNSYKTSSIKQSGKQFIIEGIIEFKSGSKKNTSFVFESVKRRNKTILEGFNKQIARANKSFRVTCNIADKKLVCERLNYRYRSNKTLVEGFVKK